MYETKRRNNKNEGNLISSMFGQRWDSLYQLRKLAEQYLQKNIYKKEEVGIDSNNLMTNLEPKNKKEMDIYTISKANIFNL